MVERRLVYVCNVTYDTPNVIYSHLFPFFSLDLFVVEYYLFNYYILNYIPCHVTRLETLASALNGHAGW